MDPISIASELHSERIPRESLMERSGNPAQRGCGVSERIKKLAEYLTVEGSLQLAAGNLQSQNKLKNPLRLTLKNKKTGQFDIIKRGWRVLL